MTRPSTRPTTRTRNNPSPVAGRTSRRNVQTHTFDRAPIGILDRDRQLRLNIFPLVSVRRSRSSRAPPCVASPKQRFKKFAESPQAIESTETAPTTMRLPRRAPTEGTSNSIPS
jgi:hypothetical protein